MAETPVIIITGPPCSGKSGIARELASRLRLPYVNKDDIKESLYDSLGWRNDEEAQRANDATYPLLFTFARALLEAGCSFIVESNFRPATMNNALRALLAPHCALVLQVHCTAPVPVLMERFRARWAAGKRHPGHADGRHDATIERNLRQGVYGILHTDGPLLQLDTSDWDAVDVTDIVTWVRQAQNAVSRQPSDVACPHPPVSRKEPSHGL